MQNRYAGDVGDYVKLALLRHLARGRKLGVAWYLYPDEGHNADGKHTVYLNEPTRWRALDPELFDALGVVVATGRSVAAIQSAGVLKGIFHAEPLVSSSLKAGERAGWRRYWFSRVRQALAECDIVFADPDNGLVDDGPHRSRQRTFGKQMPLSEVRELAAERPLVVYHHNTRYKGGHDAEVDYWLNLLGDDAVAVRATAYSCRTFFVVGADDKMKIRLATFCDRWAAHSVRLHAPR